MRILTIRKKHFKISTGYKRLIYIHMNLLTLDTFVKQSLHFLYQAKSRVNINIYKISMTNQNVFALVVTSCCDKSRTSCRCCYLVTRLISRSLYVCLGQSIPMKSLLKALITRDNSENVRNMKSCI